MTRRDYCKVCGEMVNDYDPTCSECGCSFCFSCPLQYDSLSRLEMLHCKINVLCKPIVSTEELKQFIEDINSEQYIRSVNEYIDNVFKKNTAIYKVIHFFTDNIIVNVNENNVIYKKKQLIRLIKYIDKQLVFKKQSDTTKEYSEQHTELDEPEKEEDSDNDDDEDSVNDDDKDSVNEYINKVNVKYLKDFFELTRENFYYDIPYKCNMCYKGIEIQY